MRRREFIAGLGAARWPLAARAQRPDRMRRISMLIGFDGNDPTTQDWASPFRKRLSTVESHCPSARPDWQCLAFGHQEQAPQRMLL